MKRFIPSFAITLLLLLSLLFVLTSCGFELETPTNLTVDENNKLSWSQVENARTYTLEIKNADSGEVFSKVLGKTNYSLKDFEVGDYEIRVMATGGAENKDISDWSETLYFHRDYETGCVYTPINSNTEYEITKAGTASGVVIIEDTYRGKPVTKIADNAFKSNRSITEVYLGKNIRTIGENAFYNCGQLVTVHFPDSVVSIGESVFHGCRALTSITLPPKITEIPKFAFANCRALTSVVIGDTITTIGESAFSGAAIEEVIIPDSVTSLGISAFESAPNLTKVHIGSGLSTIGEKTFNNCALLAEVTFSENSSLKTIGASAFMACAALSSVAIPDGVEDLDDHCFYRCDALENVSIPDSITHIGVAAFNGTKLYTNAVSNGSTFIYAGNWLVSYAGKKADLITLKATDFAENTVGIADRVFAAAQNLETVALPDTVKIIGEYAFNNCTALWKIETGEGVLDIQTGAFSFCTVLTRPLLGSNLTTIGSYVFQGCSMLDNNALADNSLIPASVTRIGTNAFKDTALWNKPDEDGIIYAGNWVVGYATAEILGTKFSAVNAESSLKDTVVGISDFAFSNCDTLVTLANLSKAKFIGRGAFYGCVALANVTLNTSLRVIEDFTFYKCSSLFQIAFPYNLTSIGRSAFYKCERLGSVDLSSTRNFESIGRYAFYNCTNLQTLILSDALSSISEYAFCGCSALSSVELPDSLTVIENNIFSKCSALSSLTLGNAVTEIKAYAFNKCYSLTEVVIPDSVLTIGKNAFYSCSNVTSLTIGSGMKSIGDYAFFGMTALAELHIPNGVESIGAYAFKGCSEVLSIIIPPSVNEIFSNAFYGCAKATMYVCAAQGGVAWNSRWNSSYRPVVWNCILSEDGTYVASLTTGEPTITNTERLSSDIFGVSAPERAGYTFAGWKAEDGTEYAAYSVIDAPKGIRVTAVWEAIPQIEEPDTENAE